MLNDAPLEKAEDQMSLEFGRLLKARRTALNLTQSGLADMLNVSRNTIINWEGEKSLPDAGLLPVICNVLHISVTELFNIRNYMRLSASEIRMISNFRMLSSGSQATVEKLVEAMTDQEALARACALREAYALFMVRPGTVAAGPGDEVPDEPPTFVYLRRNTVNKKADGIARVNGKSMEPVYHDGDYVYYQNACTARPGDDVIVDTDEGAVIKRVSKNNTLYSVNTSLPYGKKNDSHTIVIRGKVLGVVHPSDWPSKHTDDLLQELRREEDMPLREGYSDDP